MFSCHHTFSQDTNNLAEKLGFDHNAKLLILHVDDLGLSHSTNSAVMVAFQKGGNTSGSIMVPCLWFPEIAEFAKNNPKFDMAHLTLTIVHLAIDNDETRAVMVNHPDFGAEWRQHDLDFVLSREYKQALKDHDIKLVTWKQIGEVKYPEK